MNKLTIKLNYELKYELNEVYSIFSSYYSNHDTTPQFNHMIMEYALCYNSRLLDSAYGGISHINLIKNIIDSNVNHTRLRVCTGYARIIYNDPDETL